MHKSLSISGDLTIATLPRWIESANAFAAEHGGEGPRHLKIDFSGVEAIDSSAIALLLSWRREARKTDSRIEFEHLPENLVELASVYGVTDILTAN
jgi:phospholipid transport system transporter-binding protein